MPWVDGTWVDNQLPNNVSNFLDLALYDNTITGDMFGIAITLMFFIILYASMSYTRSPVALQSALFVSSIIGFLLMAVELVGLWVPMMFLVGFVASMILLYKGGEMGGV